MAQSLPLLPKQIGTAPSHMTDGWCVCAHERSSRANEANEPIDFCKVKPSIVV